VYFAVQSTGTNRSNASASGGFRSIGGAVRNKNSLYEAIRRTMRLHD
jgi:hypothetical protein